MLIIPLVCRLRQDPSTLQTFSWYLGQHLQWHNPPPLPPSSHSVQIPFISHLIEIGSFTVIIRSSIRNYACLAVSISILHSSNLEIIPWFYKCYIFWQIRLIFVDSRWLYKVLRIPQKILSNYYKLESVARTFPRHNIRPCLKLQVRCIECTCGSSNSWEEESRSSCCAKRSSHVCWSN